MREVGAPSDLRPSPATPPYHTKVRMFLSRTRGRGYVNFRELWKGEVRRIHLPRTGVLNARSAVESLAWHTSMDTTTTTTTTTTRGSRAHARSGRSLHSDLRA